MSFLKGFGVWLQQKDERNLNVLVMLFVIAFLCIVISFGYGRSSVPQTHQEPSTCNHSYNATGGGYRERNGKNVVLIYSEFNNRVDSESKQENTKNQRYIVHLQPPPFGRIKFVLYKFSEGCL